MVLYRLCAHDTDNKHYVISLMDRGKYGPLLEDAGVVVEHLGMPRGRVTFKGLVALWRFIRKLRPDVVQTWMYHADLIGGVIARLTGVRRILWGIRNSNLDARASSRTTILVARLCAFLSRYIPSVIVSCSQKAAAVHQSLGYMREKFVIIHNGYSLEHLKPNDILRVRLRTEWGVEPSAALLGMVARFDPQKDHANLFAALERLKADGARFRCALIGMGMTKDNVALQELTATHGLAADILLLGQRDDIPAVMNALDLHILSSSYGEAFPNVLAEAMACGTPCVTTDVGDAALIVGKTGWIVNHCDSDELARAIAFALFEMHDVQQWRRRSEESRARINERFTLERMVANYQQVWRE